MSTKDKRNRDLIRYMGMIGIDGRKEVEFEFSEDDLKALKSLLISINRRAAYEYTEDMAFSMFGIAKTARDFASDYDTEKRLLDILESDSISIGSDDFQYLCYNITGEEIESLSETNPELIDCLADAAKIYFGIDSLKASEVDSWSKKNKNKFYEKLHEQLEKSMM